MIISKTHFQLVKRDNILKVGKLANEAVNHYDDVINGTVGMMFDDDGHLADFPVVDQIISLSNDEKCKRYGPCGGSLEFKNAIKKWLFNDVNLNDVYYDAISTIGATGALAISIRNYVNKGQDVIVPDIRWSTYDNIAAQAGIEVEEYKLFDGNSFNLESFKNVVHESVIKHQRAYVIINDPCQNPTGYSLSYQEWVEILEFLSNESKMGEILLLDDIAYMNFSSENYSSIFELFTKYINCHFMVQIAFSAAKTLSIYGIRGGALVALSKEKNEIEEFTNSSIATIRALWSRPNNIASNIIEKAFLDETNNKEIKNRLAYYRKTLRTRADLYLSEAKKYNLKHHPYKDGFFVLLICPCAEEIMEKLCEKHIFIVPMADGLRISLASTKLDDIPRLVREIANVINKE